MLIAQSPRKYRDLLLLLVILPFWSNFLIRVYAWMIILGPSGVWREALNNVLRRLGIEPVPLLFSSFAVLVGLVYVHLPFMVLPLYAPTSKSTIRRCSMRRRISAPTRGTLLRVTFPLSLPGV